MAESVKDISFAVTELAKDTNSNVDILGLLIDHYVTEMGMNYEEALDAVKEHEMLFTRFRRLAESL